MTQLSLSNGYYEIPPGKLVNVVTCLEMTEKPKLRGHGLPPELALRRADQADLRGYRNLFCRVGQDFLWSSRLVMSDASLRAILSDEAVDSFILWRGAQAIGLLELDFRHRPQCELAFFGLVPEEVGAGLGAALMVEAITRAFDRQITRLWVHTCHFDHPNALNFYQRSGFRPSQAMIEVMDDPRVTGKLPRHVCPKVPLIT